MILAFTNRCWHRQPWIGRLSDSKRRRSRKSKLISTIQTSSHRLMASLRATNLSTKPLCRRDEGRRLALKLVVGDGKGAGGGAEQHQPCGVDPETQQQNCACDREHDRRHIDDRRAAQLPRHHDHQRERPGVDAVKERARDRRAPKPRQKWPTDRDEEKGRQENSSRRHYRAARTA